MRFNADDHTDRFAPIVGQHRFRIESVKDDFTKGGDPVLVLELKLDSGRLHWERFIVEHSNPKTVEIAMGKLSTLSRAVGLPRWEDEQELRGLVGEAVFGPQRDAPEFTEIKKYIVPDDQKKATASNPHRDENITRRGGQLRETMEAQGNLPPAPHPADVSDDDVPF